MKKVIVFVADALSTQWGGINVFNVEMLRALKEYPDLTTVCVVPSKDMIKEEYKHIPDHVIPLREHGERFLDVEDDAELAFQALAGIGPIEAVVGHDKVTGPLSNRIGEKVAAKVRVILAHMVYAHYYSMIADGPATQRKTHCQQNTYVAATHVFAVGDLLTKAVEDTLRAAHTQRKGLDVKVATIYPPMPDVVPVTEPAHTPRLVYSGRIETANDPIKQHTFAAQAFGLALHNAPSKLTDAQIAMFGFEDGNQESVEHVKGEIRRLAGRSIPIECHAYAESRDVMLGEIARASCVVMPSRHEGFGLVAWEAMSLGIPLIVSENSGFYQLVRKADATEYLGVVPSNMETDQAHKKAALKAFADQVRSKMANPEQAHIDAIRLREAILTLPLLRESMNAFVEVLGGAPPHVASAESIPQITVSFDIEEEKVNIPFLRVTSSTFETEAVIRAISRGKPYRVDRVGPFLQKLETMAKHDPDIELREEADRVLQRQSAWFDRFEKVCEKLLNELADESSWGGALPGPAAAIAFHVCIDHTAPFLTQSGRKLVIVGEGGPNDGAYFSVWIPLELVRWHLVGSSDFSIHAGLSVADVWPTFAGYISGWYLRKEVAEGAWLDREYRPFGSPTDWIVGTS